MLFALASTREAHAEQRGRALRGAGDRYDCRCVASTAGACAYAHTTIDGCCEWEFHKMFFQPSREPSYGHSSRCLKDTNWHPKCEFGFAVTFWHKELRDHCVSEGEAAADQIDAFLHRL